MHIKNKREDLSDNMSHAPKTKHTHIIFGNRHDAVILLQDGRTWQQLLWDTETDVIIPGQWITHTKIYPKESYLHDGFFVYSCLQAGLHEKPYACYNIVSRPPYFTALTISDAGGRMGSPHFLQFIHAQSDKPIISLCGVLLRSPEAQEFHLLASPYYPESPYVKPKMTALVRVTHKQPMDRYNPRATDNSARSRAVRIVGDKIYVSDRKLVDLSNNVFECVAPPQNYHMSRRQIDAAKTIWKTWCNCRDNPAYAVCKARLLREFQEMVS